MEHGRIGDFSVQAEQAFANVAIALESVGATFKSLLHLTIYCAESVRPPRFSRISEVR